MLSEKRIKIQKNWSSFCIVCFSTGLILLMLIYIDIAALNSRNGIDLGRSADVWCLGILHLLLVGLPIGIGLLVYKDYFAIYSDSGIKWISDRGYEFVKWTDISHVDIQKRTFGRTFIILTISQKKIVMNCDAYVNKYKVIEGLRTRIPASAWKVDSPELSFTEKQELYLPKSVSIKDGLGQEQMRTFRVPLDLRGYYERTSYLMLVLSIFIACGIMLLMILKPPQRPNQWPFAIGLFLLMCLIAAFCSYNISRVPKIFETYIEINEHYIAQYFQQTPLAIIPWTEIDEYKNQGLFRRLVLKSRSKKAAICVDYQTADYDTLCKLIQLRTSNYGVDLRPTNNLF
jgi:uncharacterized membrane protein YhaH (DUF805 family)